MSRAQALLRIYPVTASVTILLVLMAIITGNLTQGAARLSSLDLGAGITTTLEDRRWWTILTDFFVAHDLTQFIIDLAAAIVLLGIAGVPLARKPESPNSAPASTALMSLLDFLAKRLEPAYGFSSLVFFKAKFNPRCETLYMAYPDSVALPAIALAVGRAYLPNVSARKTLSMLRNLAGSGCRTTKW